MSVINIRQAQREGARLVIGISGISGSGKTYTALQLAYGLANYDASKIGFLDTENKRGSLYAESLGKGNHYVIGDLYAPFSPSRYIDAILAFQNAGVEVLIIDSITHEWEGAGGCEEIAIARNPRFPDWKRAKMEHKKFINALLQCNMHVICCIRARDKVQFLKENGETVIKSLGVTPVCEKNFMFEMTASMMMWNEGKNQQTLKCPQDLRTILGRQTDYITPKDGKALRDWVDGAKQIDENLERAKNTLRTVTEKGVDALRIEWEKLDKETKIKLGENFKNELKREAQDYDAQRSESENVNKILGVENG